MTRKYYNVNYLEREIKILRMECRENPDNYEALERLHILEQELYDACKVLNLNYAYL